MADDTEEIDPSLDLLLNKYGASRRSVKCATDDSEPSTGEIEEVRRVEQPSQFLQEIRERAEILSRNAAKARKVALQNVVNDDSKSLQTNSSLDMFVDVIRSANITGENTTSSLTVQPDDEDFISSNDLLQPIVPLDAAPWSAESPRDSGRPWDIEGTLDTGGPWRTRGHEGSKAIESPWDVDGSRTTEVPWKCESAWRIDDGRDNVESKEIEGPWKANNPQGVEGPWKIENNDSLGDYGLSTEPWGNLTSQINDDITESDDSDTTSEESSDSQDDVDGSQGNISINSTQNANSLALDREQDQLASFERGDNVVEHRDDDTSIVWDLRTYCPLSSQTENADVESEDLWSNTAVVDEEDDEDEDEDELEDDDNNKDVNNDRVKGSNESISTRTRGEVTDTVSSVILAHTFDNDLVASSPNHSNEQFDRQIDDKMSMNDGIKLVNEFDDRVICDDVARSEVHVDTTRDPQTVSAKEDGLNDEDQSLCLIGKNIGKNIPEEEGQGAGLGEEGMDQQLTTEIMDASLVRRSKEVCESSDAVEEERGKDDSVEVYSTDITAAAETDDCINPDGVGPQVHVGAITEEMEGGTIQFSSNPKLSFHTHQSESSSNLTDNLSSLYGENDGCVESNVKDDLEEVASSPHVEHSSCLDPLLPTMDVSYSAAEDDEICVRNRDEMEEATDRVSLSSLTQHPSASNHYDLLLPTVTDIISNVLDSNDGSIQDEVNKSTRHHSPHPQNSMESDTPLMDSSSLVFMSDDGNILDVSLEEDVNTEAEIDKATSRSHPLSLDQDDSESHVAASSCTHDDIIHVDVRTDLDKERHDDPMEGLLDKISTSDKEDEPDKCGKDADDVHLKIQSQTKLSLISKSDEDCKESHEELVSADVDSKEELVSADVDSKESPEELVSADVDSKEKPEELMSADEDSKENFEELVSANVDSKENPEELVSADVDSKENPEELMSADEDSKENFEELVSADVDSKENPEELVSANVDSKENPEELVSANVDSKENPEELVSANVDSKENPEELVSANVDSKENPEELVSADVGSKENPEEQGSCAVKKRSFGDGFEGRNTETGDAGHKSSSSCNIQQQSFQDERAEHDETLPHGNISGTQSLSLESMNDKGDPVVQVASAMTETKLGCDFTTSTCKTVSYNKNNSNVGNSGQDNLGDVHNVMLQKNYESLNFEEDVSCHSKFRQSTKSVHLRTSNWEQTSVNKSLTQDDSNNQTEGMLLSCSSGTTLDSSQEILKMSEKPIISSFGKTQNQDIVRTMKADHKSEKQEAKKVREGRHSEDLGRSQKVNQHRSEQSVGIRGINSSRGASSTSSERQSTPMNQDTRTKDLKSRENLSEQRGINPEDDDEGMRAGNVRNLIARFNSGSVVASDSPGSEMRRRGWGVSNLDDRVTARLTSMENAHEERPLMHKESSEAADDTVHQVIPWMQELAKRRKRREQSSVWEKLTRQMSEK